VQTQPYHIQHRGHLAHDLRESQFVESLIARRVFFCHRNLDPVLLNDAVERLVIQSVVAGRKWKVCTASPQFVFELSQIAPQDEQFFLQLGQDSGLRFQAVVMSVVNDVLLTRYALLFSIW
jgi:hypothetical protein